MVEEKTFIEKTQPKHLLEIMSEDILKMLLDSYRFPLQTPLTIYYSQQLPANTETIDWLEFPYPAQEMSLTSPFCYEYRHIQPACEKNCKQCDTEMTLRYYRGEWQGPKLSRCPLCLWEMTYPLFVWGRLVGVLYGGQVVVTKPVKDWREALKDVQNEVVWDPFKSNHVGIPQKSKQIDEILSAIEVAEELKNANDEKDKLRDILEKEKEKKVDTSKLLDRYDKFKKFGKTLEKVIGDLFAARAEAARREHIHLASRYIIERGNWLSEEPQSFWHALDNIVRATLPDVIGYVFYRLDEYREAFNPVQTCVYDRGLILEDADFRNFCKHVFEELHEKGKKRKDFVFYDLLSQENTPQILHGLFRRTVSDSKKVDGGVVAIAVPLAESDGKIAGGMVCMCTISQQNSIRQRGLFRFYVEALMDIIDMLSMVMARHDVEKAQATAWAMRSHELIAPIHAVKGYQDNLVFLFRNDIANKLENDPDTKNMFAARLVRLGMLCDLLELIASGGSLEGAEYFVPINFEKQILLPIVQPLRDYGKMEKEVDVWYSDKIANLPKLWLSTDGIKRCMFNLIFNAIKYSYRTSRIMVELQETKGNYEIHIVNKGIGVPNGEEERIFRMFTEGSNADQAAAYGAGLGLPVARGMARKHGGDVTLVSGTPERTVFSLVLPKSLEFGPPNKNLSSELML